MLQRLLLLAVPEHQEGRSQAEGGGGWGGGGAWRAQRMPALGEICSGWGCSWLSAHLLVRHGRLREWLYSWLRGPSGRARCLARQGVAFARMRYWLLLHKSRSSLLVAAIWNALCRINVAGGRRFPYPNENSQSPAGLPPALLLGRFCLSTALTNHVSYNDSSCAGLLPGRGLHPGQEDWRGAAQEGRGERSQQPCLRAVIFESYAYLMGGHWGSEQGAGETSWGGDAGKKQSLEPQACIYRGVTLLCPKNRQISQLCPYLHLCLRTPRSSWSLSCVFRAPLSTAAHESAVPLPAASAVPLPLPQDAKILVANTAMDTDKVKIYGARVRVDSMAKVGGRLVVHWLI